MSSNTITDKEVGPTPPAKNPMKFTLEVQEEEDNLLAIEWDFGKKFNGTIVVDKEFFSPELAIIIPNLLKGIAMGAPIGASIGKSIFEGQVPTVPPEPPKYEDLVILNVTDPATKELLHELAVLIHNFPGVTNAASRFLDNIKTKTSYDAQAEISKDWRRWDLLGIRPKAEWQTSSAHSGSN